jgi:class 3 adenylate cyclase
VFSAFDDLARRHGLEKIKTIGDAYMVVAGVPEPRADHAEAMAEMALDMQAGLGRLCEPLGLDLAIRVGMASGPVIAGVIGRDKFSYDLWGDTVNTASRMESHSLPGRIQVTAATYERLHDRYQFEERGDIEVKGKGRLKAYLLVGRRSHA